MLEKLIFRADFFLTFFFFFRRTIVAYRFAISKEDGAWMEDFSCCYDHLYQLKRNLE